MSQKFRPGDMVRVAAALGPTMDHFPGAGERAIVIGSYADQYGAHNYGEQWEPEYTLKFKDYGPVSWYRESQLTLIERWHDDVLGLSRLERPE